MSGVRFVDLAPQDLIDLLDDVSVTNPVFLEIQREIIRRLTDGKPS